MQFMIRGRILMVAGILLPFMLIQVNAADMESLKDTVGSELLTQVDVQRDALGDLGDASTDVDAPEQLNLPSPPKAHTATPGELALLQGKTVHKQEPVEAPRQLRAKRQVVPQPAAEQASAVSVEPVAKWEAPKDEAKSDDADVEQLGGQLQNIEAELGDTAPAVEKKQLQKASAAPPAEKKQAPAVAEASESEEDIEKEAGDAGKSGESQKDDTENVVDGAMAYIRTRLATEEHKSLRLRQLLQQAVRSNRNMRTKLEQFGSQLTEGAKLQKTLRIVSAQKVSQEEDKLVKEKARADTVTKQLVNATKAAQIGEKAMKFLGMRLKYTKSQVAALLLNLANSSQQNNDLRHRLATVSTTEAKDAKMLAAAKKQNDEQAKELAETKAALKKLQGSKKAEDSKMVSFDRQRNLLEHREVSTDKRDKILKKENNLLKKNLATEIQREEQLREMWSKESEAFTWQLRAERANASESLMDLEKARNEFRDLRERVQKLRQRASDGEKNRHNAEDAANRAQFALAEAEAENKQLKGSVPWLEAEVDRQRQAAQNATKEASQMLKERDTVKAILSEAQRNIVQLQGQYADALQALVVAQAGGSDAAKPQAPASSIQQFAGLGQQSASNWPDQSAASNPLGLPPVASPIGFAQADGGPSSLLELSRDSKALNNMMGGNQAGNMRGKVDLNAVLRGMNGGR